MLATGPTQVSSRIYDTRDGARGMDLNLNATIGSIFIGYTVSLWLYGISLSQIGLFYHNNRDSSRFLKAIVFVLFVLENAQTILTSQGMWLYVVSYHFHPQGLARPPRSFGVLVYITSMINVIVRGMYSFRIYKLGRQRLVLPLLVVLLSFVVATLACVYGTQGVKMEPWRAGRDLSWIFYTGYACELTADLLITSSMVIILARRNVGLRRSDKLAQTFMLYSINSGLLVMICVICSTVAYIAIPNSLAFLAIYIALGKLYTNSLLGSLNARDVIFPRASREAHAAPTSAPLLTSVVVLDNDDDDMLETVNQEQGRGENRDTNGSFESDETRVERLLAQRQKAKVEDVEIVQLEDTREENLRTGRGDP